MKIKCFYIFTILILLTCIFIIPNKVSAQSPTATLRVDGGAPIPYDSVQDAIDDIEFIVGTEFLVEIANGTVTEAINILQHTDKNVYIRPQSGATVTVTKTITIDGNGQIDGRESVVIENIIFDFTDDSAPAECIYLNLIPGRVGNAYTHNVFVNGCTFNGIYDKTVAVRSTTGGTRNLSIMNSTATDMHSLAQLRALSGFAFIQNVTLQNSDGGVNFFGEEPILYIDSCNFDVTGYAVRSGQTTGNIRTLGAVNINNSILTSNSPGIGTIVLRGDSTNNINIIHSNITNNEGGPYIQNENDDSISSYDIDLIESNVSGQVDRIATATMSIIDAPDVKNGPICVQSSNGIGDNGNGDNGNDLITMLLTIILVVLAIVLIAILLPFIVAIFIIRRLLPR